MKLNKIVRKIDWFFYGLLILMQLVGILVFSQLINRKTTKLTDKKHQLLALEKKDQSLITLQQDYQFLEKDFDVLNTVLPDKEKLIDFIGEIEKEATSSGIIAEISLSDQSVKEESDQIKSIQFSLEFEATYFKMNQFIKKLEEMPQIITVEKITIHSPQGIDTKNNIVLQLKCYIDPSF
jgi:Tfp pilus assembly protein PilO